MTASGAAARIAASQGRLARHFSATQVKLTAPAIAGGLNDDLSVTLGVAATQTVDCSYPRELEAAGTEEGDVREGTTWVTVERALLTVEPQRGWIADLLGEQYRVHRVTYLPGEVRIYLRGGAAEGPAGG